MTSMSPNNTLKLYAGVDVAKQSLQLDWNGQSVELSNDAKGFAKLQKLLGPPSASHVVMEATGGYERALADSLHAAGYALSIVLPSRVRAFAHACGQWAKTDPIDAKVIRWFAQAVHPTPTRPPTPQQRRLEALVLRRSQLVEAKKALCNQSEHHQDAWIVRQIRTQQAGYEKQIAACEAQIAALLAADEELTARTERLQQVPGVGKVMAAMLQAYLPELGTLGAEEAAALVGVAPYPVDSGSHQGVRAIRGGRKPARGALFLVAMCAVRHDPILKAFYQRLRERGKMPLVALTAVMRKLVLLLNRLLQDPSFQLRHAA
jgi:transposase